MVTYGRRRRNLVSTLTTFYYSEDEDEGEGTRPLRSPSERCSDELSLTSSLHDIAKIPNEHIRHADSSQPVMERTPLMSDRDGPKALDKPLPPKPVEKEPSHAQDSKVTSAHKSSTSKMFSRNAISKSPAKSPRKLQISAPSQPHQGVPQSHPFDTSKQAWIAMAQEHPRAQGLIPSSIQQIPAEPERRAAGNKSSIPRSSSMFSFSSSMSHVGSSLGNLFKFGSYKTKTAPSKVNKVVNEKNTRGSSPLDVSKDQPIVSSVVRSPFSADTSASRGPPSSHRVNFTSQDHQAHNVISGSPQLQRFFYGPKPFDQSLAGSSPQIFPPIHENGSAATARSSMYDLGRYPEDPRFARWENGLRNDPDVQPRGLGFLSTLSDQEEQTNLAKETKYQFSDKITSRLNTAPPRPARPDLEPTLAQADQDRASSYLRIDEGVENDSAVLRSKYNEDISGLLQHPNVLEFAEPPDWYKMGLAGGVPKDVIGRAKLKSYPQMPNKPRNPIFYGPTESHFFEHSASASDSAIPLIEVNRASTTSTKRNSKDAELTADSPTKLKRSKSDGIEDEFLAGVKLMTALEQIHGIQSDHDDNVAHETDVSGPLSQGVDQAGDDAYYPAAENESLLHDPLVPPRHPGRLLRPNRFRRTSTPLATQYAQNSSDNQLLYTNFSTQWPAMRRWGCCEQDDDDDDDNLASPTGAFQNTSHLLSSPSFLSRRGYVEIEDEDDNELQSGDNYFGIGLAE